MPQERQGLLEGKQVTIFGAGLGVGRASALHFCAEGARVVVADIDAERAKETVRLVEETGGTAVPFTVDVSNEEEVAAAIAATVDAFGSVDAVFNNVGIPTPRVGMSFEEHSSAEIERLFAVNVRGVLHGMKQALLQFKVQGTGGAIVNTGSVAGLVGWGGAVYGATKGAVHQLTRAVAIEAAPAGVRVNAICPAAMPFTGFMPAGGAVFPEERMDEIARGIGAMHPLGHPITAEDCAAAAAFLLSDRAANITGVLLPVDGGYVAR